jgi:cell division transport system permease protein
MSPNIDQYQRRRLISSYFSVVLSIFLVLFLLGSLGFFVVHSNRLSERFKEEIAVSVYFHNNVSKEKIEIFQELLKQKDYVKEIVFISKEQAAKEHKDIIGEDFMAFLGYNPLQNSMDVYFKSDYVAGNKIAELAMQLKADELVSDVVYDKELVELVNQNVKKISFWILLVSSMLAIIAVLLINSSMRLSIYAKRFIIKTMQLVGATKSFIRRPFIWQSIKLGLIGAVLACLTLLGLLYYLDTILPGLELLADMEIIGVVMLGVLISSVLITGISTFFATQRFLNLRTGDLY